MSLFITFEGGEGSGKSVQSKRLYRRLGKLAAPAVLVHEPGVTFLGKRVSHVLKWVQGTSISPVAELLLFNVSRAQLVTEVIKPALAAGQIVICDRYADSTLAYQGYGRGLDMATVNQANNIGMMGCRPDMTVLLDIPVARGLPRARYRKSDRFEQEDTAFHQRVREGYLKLVQQEPDRWLVIDAEQSKEEIADIIWDRVRKLLPG